jgi:hypothetical protein
LIALSLSKFAVVLSKGFKLPMEKSLTVIHLFNDEEDRLDECDHCYSGFDEPVIKDESDDYLELSVHDSEI